MRISSYSGKAQAFVNGKWSVWMSQEEAKKLEDVALYGTRPYRGVFLLEDAKRLGIAPAGIATPRKRREIK